jgi:hypothetical protein
MLWYHKATFYYKKFSTWYPGHMTMWLSFLRSLAIIELEIVITWRVGADTANGNHRIGGLVGFAIGLVGTGIGLVTAIGLIAVIGLVGTWIGLMGAAIGLTGALVGNFGFTSKGESPTGAWIGVGMIGMVWMEASFAMAALKKKRAATVIVSWNLKNVFMINDSL